MHIEGGMYLWFSTALLCYAWLILLRAAVTLMYSVLGKYMYIVYSSCFDHTHIFWQGWYYIT